MARAALDGRMAVAHRVAIQGALTAITGSGVRAVASARRVGPEHAGSRIRPVTSARRVGPEHAGSGVRAMTGARRVGRERALALLSGVGVGIVGSRSALACHVDLVPATLPVTTLGLVGAATRLVGPFVIVAEMLNVGPPRAGLCMCHAVLVLFRLGLRG